MNDGIIPWDETATTKLVVARGLQYRGNDTHVSDIDFSIERGELFGIFGPPGAGKRALVRVLSGSDQPSAGSLSLVNGRTNGQPTLGLSEQRVGFVPCRRGVDPAWSPRQALMIEAQRFDRSSQQAVSRTADLLDIAALVDQADRPVEQLSSSMRRRLDIVLGLVHEPDMLVIEEPLSGVEAILSDPVWSMLERFTASGLAIIATTRDFTLVDRFDRVLLLDRGRMRALGSPDAIRHETFGGDLICMSICGLDRPLVNRIISLPYVRRAIRLDADRIQILLADYRRDRKRLESVLRRSGYRSLSIRKCKMPFNRVFQALTI